MIITTAERIIKTTQADRTDGTIMLYAVNCHYMHNASPKTNQNLMKFKKSKNKMCTDESISCKSRLNTKEIK